MRTRNRQDLRAGLTWLVGLAVMAASTAWVRAQSDPSGFEKNQNVEVREGDVWSSAVILNKEGRRYQIRYSDETTEWVTADRVRRPQAVATNEAPDASATGRPTPAAPKFRPRERVDIKWGGAWKGGVVKQRQGELYLIAHDGWDRQFHWEWVTEDRLRKPGGSEEGPDGLNQFGHKVGNDSIPASLQAAKAALKADSARSASRGTSGFVPPPLDKPLTDADRSGMQAVVPQPGEGRWTIQPDPPAAPAPLVGRPIGLSAFDEKTGYRMLAPSITGSLAMVRAQAGSPAAPTDVRIEWVDLRTGRPVGRHEVPPASLPLAVSPSGELVAARSNGFHIGTKSRLDLWRREGKTLEHVVSFVPVPEDRTSRRDIESICFIDDHRAIVATSSKIGCWDLAAAKGIWELDVPFMRSTVALSPGRKYLATAADNHLLFLDAGAGKVVGSLPGAPGSVETLAFSPDGRRIAAVGGNVLFVWNLEDGHSMPSIGIPPAIGAGSLAFVDHDNLLIGQTLFNLPASAPVWSYEIGGTPSDEPAGGRLWTVLSERNRHTLVSWQLPDAAAKAAIVRTLPAESVLQPGTAVTLDLGGIDADENLRRQITQSLTEQLTRRKITIADSRPIRLIGRTESGRSEQRTYQTIGGGPFNRDQQTVNVTDKVTRLFIEVDGKVAWERQAVSTAGGMVHLQEGQSVQQAVDASQGKSAGFLQHIILPDIVLPPREPITAGTSKLVQPGALGGGVKN